MSPRGAGLVGASCFCAMAWIVIIASALSLMGCVTAPPAPASPQQAVYALEGEYAAALAVGAAYNELPRCKPTGPTLCSDPAKVAQLREAVNAANAALLVVETTARAKGDVVSALLVASAIVDSLRLLTLDMKVK